MGLRETREQRGDSNTHLHAIWLRDAEPAPKHFRQGTLGGAMRILPREHRPGSGPCGNARRPKRRTGEDELGSDKNREKDNRQGADQLKRNRALFSPEPSSPALLLTLAHARTLTAMASQVARQMQLFSTRLRRRFGGSQDCGRRV